MTDTNETDTEAATPRTTRRAGGFLLSFLGPGLGHVARGRWSRAVTWCGIHLAFFGSAILLAMLGFPRGMWIALGCSVIVYLIVPFDAVRGSFQGGPRWRYVAIVAIGVSLFVNLLTGWVRSSLLEAFSMPSGSMYPTLEIGDHIMTTKLPRRFERGDVVVFRSPLDPTVTYVKRIAAIGGDRIEFRGRQLLLNGQAAELERSDKTCVPRQGGGPCSVWREKTANRKHLIALNDGRSPPDLAPVQVPIGHYFLLGDNRDNSNDFRFLGTVPEKLLIGRATFIWWSSEEPAIRWERINKPIE